MARLYETPNGGNRLLPSAYTALTNSWVRSNWIEVTPSKMNDGHLNNTLKLLIESHGNLIARSTSVLGKIHAHFGNCPEVQAKLEEVCILMQQAEVNEVYPVFNTLAEEFDSRLFSKFVAPLPGNRPFEKTLDLWDDLK